jgi:SAM-dependent methyltransferase
MFSSLLRILDLRVGLLAPGKQVQTPDYDFPLPTRGGSDHDPRTTSTMAQLLSGSAPNSPPASQANECACPLCRVGTRDRYVGIVAEETGERFRVRECPRCGLGLTLPVPVDMDAYYQASYYGSRHGLTDRICIRRRLRLARSAVGAGTERTLLDFGCGDGSFLLAAQDEGWKCRGVERKRPACIPDSLSVVGSLDELSDGPPFACATFWHVLEHLEDPVEVLRCLRPHVEPGGVILAAVPNFGSFQARATGASWLHLDIPRHLHHFTETSLRKTFEAAGYRVLGVSYGEIEYDVIGWSQSLLNRGLRGQNEFFKAVSGRSGGRLTLHRALQVPAGLALSFLSTVPAWGERLIGRAGTLILRAQSPKAVEG